MGKVVPAGGDGGRGRGEDGAGTRASRSHYTTNKQLLHLHDGRVVAEVVNGVLVKRVKASVHQLRTPRAWAVDTGILREAERLGARWIEIHDAETGVIYRASLARFWERGFPVRRGHGEQRALALSEWSRDGAGSRADWVQTSLFGAAEVLP